MAVEQTERRNQKEEAEATKGVVVTLVVQERPAVDLGRLPRVPFLPPRLASGPLAGASFLLSFLPKRTAAFGPLASFPE